MKFRLQAESLGGTAFHLKAERHALILSHLLVP